MNVRFAVKRGSVVAWRHFSGLMYCGIQGHSWIPSGGQASWRLGEQMQSPLPSLSLPLSLPRGNDDHTKGEKRISRQSRSTRPTDNDNGRAAAEKRENRADGGVWWPPRRRRRHPRARVATAASLRETFAATV